MNFRRGFSTSRDDPEINFIPLIDLLLVILIFLMVTTTYTKFNELKVELPGVRNQSSTNKPAEMTVVVGNDGQASLRALDGTVVGNFNTPASLAAEMRKLVIDKKDTVVLIYADAGASHQAVVAVMDAARQAGLERVSIAAQAPR
jgi:biopolymer transport protein ExbD